jgi:hypothetical protein
VKEDLAMTKLRDEFEKTVLETTEEDITKHTKAAQKDGHALKCDDQFVATIEITKSKVCFIDNDIETVDRNERQNYYKSKYINTIALILESPHTEEFDKDRCLGPAMGTTGDGIKNILLGNLAKFIFINDLLDYGSYFKTSSEITEGLYKLLIVNAVQYQCSLGNLENDASKRKRNKIFEDFFEKTAKEDFKRRLKLYNPKIIINCCTGGHYGEVDGLQKRVQEVIDSGNFSALKLIGSHPSSAFFARGFCKV